MLELQLAGSSDEGSGADRALRRRYHFEHGVPDLAGAQPELIELLVEEAPVSFQLLRRGRAWIAWTTLAATSIVVSGRGVAPGDIRLERLESLEELARDWRWHEPEPGVRPGVRAGG